MPTSAPPLLRVLWLTVCTCTTISLPVRKWTKLLRFISVQPGQCHACTRAELLVVWKPRTSASCKLLAVPATCQYTSGTDLLRHFSSAQLPWPSWVWQALTVVLLVPRGTGSTICCQRSNWFLLNEHVSPEQSWSLTARPRAIALIRSSTGTRLQLGCSGVSSPFCDYPGLRGRRSLSLLAEFWRLVLSALLRLSFRVDSPLWRDWDPQTPALGLVSCGQFRGSYPRRLPAAVGVFVVGAGVGASWGVLAFKRAWGQVVRWP